MRAEERGFPRDVLVEAIEERSRAADGLAHVRPETVDLDHAGIGLTRHDSRSIGRRTRSA